MYVIWHDNALYFSFENKHKKIVLTRPEFDEIFIQARQLYAKIIDNSTTKQSTLIDPNQVYPLNWDLSKWWLLDDLNIGVINKGQKDCRSDRNNNTMMVEIFS